MRLRPTMQAAIALLLVILSCASLPGVAGAPAPTTVKVAFTPLQAWGPLFIAEHEGFFAREGIKIEWATFAGGADTIAVLIQGSLDVGAGAASAGFFNAIARGEQVRIVADKGYAAPGSRAVALVARKNLRPGGTPTIADLKGRRIAVNTLGAVAHYLVGRYLAKGGLTLNDVDIVRMPFPAMIPALQQGAVDAANLSEPFVSQAVETGAGVLMMAAGDVAPDEPIAYIFYGPNFLTRSPDVARRFMVAYVRALRQYAAGPTDRNVRIVADYTKIGADVIKKGDWFPMRADGAVNVNAIRRFQDWLYEQQLIGVRMPVGSVVDATFLTHAAGVLVAR